MEQSPLIRPGRATAVHWLCALVLAQAFVLPLQAAEGAPADRPKIGLVLSGGGARGAAHVGVLKVLEDLRVPIDYIAGTSMGSIIGGLYASGMSPAEIEEVLARLDWEHIFSDAPARQYRSFRRKRDDDLYLVKAKPGITDDWELTFPTGAIQGQKFDLALRELTLPVSVVSDFDRLRIPFRAVATDIGTGQRIVLGSGDLATAMRASMSVPGAFAATEIDGRLLVDGGIIGNLPVDVVREMGADIVIAVDISSPLAPADTVDNMLRITGQLTSIMTRSNVEQQISSLGMNDVLIVPDLEGIESGDFKRSAETVPRGQRAAEAQRMELSSLALSEGEYQRYLSTLTPLPDQSLPVIDFIRIENDSTVADELIRIRISQQLGEQLDLDQLERDIGTVYGLELFQSVRYDLINEYGQTGLLIKADARSWGPNYLQMGVELSSDGEGQSSYNLGLAYLRTGINSLAGEIRLATQFGAEPRIGGDWYQPLDALTRYFVHTQVGYGVRDVNQYVDGELLAEYKVTEGKFDLSGGRELGQFGEVRIGYRFRSGEVELDVGTRERPDFDYTTAQVYGRLFVDRLDNYHFPEHGWLGASEYAVANEGLGSDAPFDQWTNRLSAFTTFGDGHVLGAGGVIKTTFDGTADIQDRFRLGGFLNLSGYAEDSLTGEQAGVVAAIYYRRVRLLPFLAWYAGGSLEYGGVWENREDIGEDGIAAGSVFLGADTPIGPLYLGYGRAEGGGDAIFFNLGRPLFY